ncbi:hypothetical protein D3C80_1148950 [compost metagenome]
MNSGFEKSAGDKLKALQPKIELFKTYLAEDIKNGDVFELTYSPNDNSVFVFKNKTLKGKVEGFEFKRALFGIWLSDNPIDEELKKSLLGL